MMQRRPVIPQHSSFCRARRRTRLAVLKPDGGAGGLNDGIELLAETRAACSDGQGVEGEVMQWPMRHDTQEFRRAPKVGREWTPLAVAHGEEWGSVSAEWEAGLLVAAWPAPAAEKTYLPLIWR